MNVDRVRDVVTHLDMALYAQQAADAAAFQAQFGNPIPHLYHMFASLNLLNTLFLVDRDVKRGDPMGGYVYRTLKQDGLVGLLEPIRRILEHPVGRTTFGDIIRQNRNKLTVHGNMDFGSLPQEVQEVPFNQDAMEVWEALMEEFIIELRRLREALEKLIP